MRRFWLASSGVLLVQLVALLAYSTHLYTRFDESVDFAHNIQAWFLIGHGNLSPTDTVRITATPFWRDHFDLILWPLSLLRFVWPQPVVLLWVQDLAIVAAELVTLMWVAAIIGERLGSYRNTVGIVALVALVANPWWYEATSFDLHMPPLGLPFVVLAGYSLWGGRFRRGCVAAAISLLFGAVVVELVVVVGIAALLSRRVRESGGARYAAGITIGGIVWILAVNALGANQASNLAANYGYLASSPNVSVFSILRGVVLHPSRATHVLSQRWRSVVFELWPTGLLGLLTPWGLLLFLGLLVPSALTRSSAYSTATSAAFQNVPAMPFLFVGTVLVLTGIATRSTEGRASAHRRTRIPDRLRARVAAVLGVAATVVVVIQGSLMIGRIPDDWLLVNSSEAVTLEKAMAAIPTSAEVIASYGVMGRFAERRSVLTLAAAPQTFAVSSRDVFFLITPSVATEPLGADDSRADIGYLSEKLHARTVVAGDGIWLLEWRPASAVRSVVLPGTHPEHAGAG
jgi:uncharacterized membrane protein